MKLAKGEMIITAWAEYASGPGWSNTPVWIIVRDGNGKLEERCIQPDEQSGYVMDLYRIAATVHAEFLARVKTLKSAQFKDASTGQPGPRAPKEGNDRAAE